MAFLPTRDRACLHEGAGPTAGPGPAVHTAPRADRGGRCAARAQGSGALAKYARVWGKSGFDGQHVGRDHPLADGDVVELHT